MKTRVTTLSEDFSALNHSRSELAEENKQIIKLKCEAELLEGDSRQKKNEIQSLVDKNRSLESKVEELESLRLDEHEQKVNA